MSRRFTSFLLRFWERDDGSRRIEIEHIQDGARVVVASSTTALDWIDARVATDRAARTLSDEPGPQRNGPTDEGEPLS